MLGERPIGAATDIVELFVAPLWRITVDGSNDPSRGRNKAERLTSLANPFRLVKMIENFVEDPTGRVTAGGLEEMLKSGEAARGGA